VKGQYSGDGNWCNASGDCYSGSFQYGQRHGGGELSLITGDKMKGEWVNGIFTSGIYAYNNGDVYIGDFKNGVMNGFGKYYRLSTSKCYQGYYENGELAL